MSAIDWVQEADGEVPENWIPQSLAWDKGWEIAWLLFNNWAEHTAKCPASWGKKCDCGLTEVARLFFDLEDKPSKPRA